MDDLMWGAPSSLQDAEPKAPSPPPTAAQSASSPPAAAATTSATSSTGGGGWWGWVQQATENVVNIYKEELSDFTKQIEGDTKAAASKAVSEEQLKKISSGLSSLSPALSSLVEGLSNTSHVGPGRHSPTLFLSRFEASVHSLQEDPNTYLLEIESDDAAEFAEWSKAFALAEKTEEISSLLASNDKVRGWHSKNVPDKISYGTFWKRYFFRLSKVEQTEKKRAEVLQKASQSSQEDDLKWDDEDEISREIEERARKLNVADPPPTQTPTQTPAAPPVTSPAPTLVAPAPTHEEVPAPVKPAPVPAPVEPAPVPAPSSASASASATAQTESASPVPVLITRPVTPPQPAVADPSASLLLDLSPAPHPTPLSPVTTTPASPLSDWDTLLASPSPASSTIETTTTHIPVLLAASLPPSGGTSPTPATTSTEEPVVSSSVPPQDAAAGGEESWSEWE